MNYVADVCIDVKVENDVNRGGGVSCDVCSDVNVENELEVHVVIPVWSMTDIRSSDLKMEDKVSTYVYTENDGNRDVPNNANCLLLF